MSQKTLSFHAKIFSLFGEFVFTPPKIFLIFFAKASFVFKLFDMLEKEQFATMRLYVRET